MRFQRILQFVCITLFSLLLFCMTTRPGIAASLSPGESSDVCVSEQWITVGLADVYQGAYHLHVQLQALFDATDTTTYCGRVIANSYLDAPGSSNGSLDAEIYGGPTVFNTAGYTQCQVPSQCTITAQDPVRGLTGFEAGGAGHSIALDDSHPIVDNIVKSCGSYTEASTDSNNPSASGSNSINMTCTDWYTPPGVMVRNEL